jgi:hypothetical protein
MKKNNGKTMVSGSILFGFGIYMIGIMSLELLLFLAKELIGILKPIN